MKGSEMRCSAYESARRSCLTRTASAALAGMLLAFGSASALAGVVHLDASIVAAVPADPADGSKWVSYSRSDQGSQAPFTVTIANPTPSNLNNAWLKISTLPDNTALPSVFVLPTGGVQQVPYGSCAADPSIPSGSPITSIVCNLGGIVTGAPAVFTLVVQAPQYSTNDPTPTTFALNGTLQAGQGNAQSNPSQVVNVLSDSVQLRKTTSAKARGYVNGGSPFNVLDTFAVTQITPPSPVTAGVEQNENPSSCGAQYKTCLLSSVTIVDLTGQTVSFAPANLVIDLTRNKSTLKNKADITTAVLFYAPTLNDTPRQIIQCDVDITGPAPVFSIPGTISQAFAQGRCVIPVSPANPYTYVDSSGNWHFRILGFTNGLTFW